MTTIPVNVSAIVDGQRIDAADVLVPINDLKTAIEAAIDGGYDFLKTMWIDPTSVTITAGVITITQTRHLLNNEAAALTDDLVTISGADMDFLILQQGVVGQTTTIKHNAGNIWFDDGRDYVLNDRNRVVPLFWNATSNKWSSVAANMGDLWLNAGVNNTINTDAIQLTRSKQILVPEAGLTDNLATINNTLGLAVIVLTTANGNTITIKHNTGNIWLASLEDYVLSGPNDTVTLVFNDSSSKWTNLTAYSLAPLSYRDIFFGANPSSDFTLVNLPPYGYTVPAAGQITLEYIPRIAARRLFWEEVIVGTTLDAMGMAVTAVGTPTANPVAARQYVRMTSGAVIGNFASRRSNATIFQYRWSPVFECVVDTIPGNPVNQDNNPAFFGLMAGTPVVAAGPAITYVGVSGILLRPYTSGGTTWAGQVWSAGVKLGQVLFGSLAATSGIPLRIWIDATNNLVYFEANGERSTGLSIVPGGLTTVALDAFVGIAAATAVAVLFDYACMYGEQT